MLADAVGGGEMVKSAAAKSGKDGSEYVMSVNLVVNLTRTGHQTHRTGQN